MNCQGLYPVPQMIARCFYGPGRHPSLCRFMSAQNYIRTYYFSRDCKKKHDVHQFMWITGSCNRKKNTKKMITSLLNSSTTKFRCSVYKIFYLFVLHTQHVSLSFRLILLRNSGHFSCHKQIQIIFGFSLLY